ncbi:PREDICTED: LOC110769998 isoform X1, partial [Prunus dulcis]
GSRYRTEAEQLKQRQQERVRNLFPGHPRTLFEQDLQEEITEQEPQQNENREAKNTNGSNKTNNITNNNIAAINSADVRIRNVGNKYKNS